MFPIVAFSVISHVPTYGTGTGGCFSPPHHHTTSQVMYGKASGGVEKHFSSPTEPFDQISGELIDFDFVFAKKYDQSTYSLFVGCTGCVHFDPIVIPPVQLSGYQHGELEPFTGTTYFSVFPKSQRKFNSSELLYCDQGHFGLRVVDYHNRSDGSELVWGGVIGLGETYHYSDSNLSLCPHSDRPAFGSLV